MSKIIDEIKAELTGKIRASRSRLKLVEVVKETTVTPYHPRLYEYRVGVQLGSTVSCQREDLVRVQDVVARQITSLIYGEFISRLRELEIAIYEEDQEAIQMQLRDINRMVGG